MKTSLLLLLPFLATVAVAQTMTYSPEESDWFQQLNNARLRALISGSESYCVSVVDSMDQFLSKYPNSMYKNPLLTYKVEITVAYSSDSTLIGRMCDSVLVCDTTATTKLLLGETLIRQAASRPRGVRLLEEAIHGLHQPRDLYRAHRRLAEAEIALKQQASAMSHLDQAVAIDSTDEEAWRVYLVLAHAMQDSALTRRIQDRLEQLGKAQLAEVEGVSAHSENLSKSVTGYVLRDLKGKQIVLGTLQKPLLLNFFAFWCSHCMEELPHLKSLSRDFPQVQFVYVDIGEFVPGTREKNLAKPEFRFLNSEMLLTAGPEVTQALGIRGVPRTLLVDNTGRIRSDYVGFVQGSREKLIESLKEVMISRP